MLRGGMNKHWKGRSDIPPLDEGPLPESLVEEEYWTIAQYRLERSARGL